MNKFISIVATVLALAFGGAAAAGDDDIKLMQADMIQPVVMVESGDSVGSGTIIFSSNRDDEIATYVLTNNHVISGSLPDPASKTKPQRVSVKQFVYDANGVNIATVSRPADIVRSDDDDDIAILKLVDTTNTFTVAHLVPAGEQVEVFDPVVAVGAGLHRPPFPTMGIISNTDSEINGNRVYQESAPIIFGNSGGALFRYSDVSKHYELIGIPEAVAVHESAVSHMGFAIPFDTVRALLVANDLGFIVGAE